MTTSGAPRSPNAMTGFDELDERGREAGLRPLPPEPAAACVPHDLHVRQGGARSERSDPTKKVTATRRGPTAEPWAGRGPSTKQTDPMAKSSPIRHVSPGRHRSWCRVFRPTAERSSPVRGELAVSRPSAEGLPDFYGGARTFRTQVVPPARIPRRRGVRRGMPAGWIAGPALGARQGLSNHGCEGPASALRG